MKSLTVYSFVFFLYKKRSLSKHEKPYRKIPESEQNNHNIKFERRKLKRQNATTS